MTIQYEPEDVELLARIAARLAGQDPDRRVTVKLGSLVAFDDLAWRYPDFIQKAEQACQILGYAPAARATNLFED